MKRRFPLLALVLAALACGLPAPAPAPTATPAPSATPAPPTATLTPSPAPTRTATAAPTLTPTRTPFPTATPVILAVPEVVDLSGPEHAGRPLLSGTVRVADTAHFRIFYTLSGSDAVRLEDRNGNAIPDYIEVLARTLEFAWEVLVDDLGWAAPPADRGRGGSDLLDLYVMDMDFSIAGMATGGEIEQIIGDNPNTPAVERYASFSFLRLDNDFAEVEELDMTVAGINAMRTTAVHEFMHALQFGYDSLEPISWLWEATATWAETVVLSSVTDGPFHLTASFKSPDTCLLSYGGFERYEDVLHWYSRWLFLHFISETHGQEVVRGIWEGAVDLEGYAAVDAALAAAGTNLVEVIQAYEVALLFRQFAFGLDYPTVRLEAVLDGQDFYRPENGVGQLGADFVEIEASGVVHVTLRQVTDGMLVGVLEDRADVYDLVGGEAAIDASQYEHVYLIVLNFSRAETFRDCAFQPYSIETKPGEGLPAPDRSIELADFQQPQVEGLHPTD